MGDSARTASLGVDPATLVVGARRGPTNPFDRFESHWTERAVGECFRARSQRFQERIALGLPHRDVSYGDLDRLSDQIAGFLLTEFPTVGTPVVVLLDHDAQVPAVILGVAKAGAIVVPLDPSYPAERNQFILDETGAAVCLTNERNLVRAAELNGLKRIVTIGEIEQTGEREAPSVRVGPDDLFQIMYTSGSSGRPKGVMRSHRMVLHNAMRHTNGRHIAAGDRIALLFSYSFGAAMSNVLATILNGATLLPFNLRELGVERLAAWLGENDINQFHIVPTAFRRLAESISDKESLRNLRLVQLGGEAMFRNDLELFKRHFPDHTLLGVGMGTSETGHLLQCYFDKNSDYELDRLPAGYPAAECKIIVADEYGAELGPGEVGEIVVRGSFVASGYWRRAELTRQVFRTATNGDGLPEYRTGDLGCVTADGCVFHLGRKDARVKIRGYRIEMGEVESGLRSISGVVDAVAVVVEGLAGDSRLSALVVVDDESPHTAPTLRHSLRVALPDYMLPSTIQIVDALPLLPNGKVDREAASKIAEVAETFDGRADGAETPKRAPRYLLEAQLCAVWEELLGVERVGVDEDFYDLGGDSLLAVDMFTAVEELTGRGLSPVGFIAGLTVERLCESIINLDRESFRDPVVRLNPDGSGQPFFFHSGDLETGGLYCRNLARHLNLDRPFCVMLGHGIAGDVVPSTIEEMAEDRLREITEIQPHGPYQLGGFCFGGLVAYEMARKLRERGEEVHGVLLIDTKTRYTNARVGPIMRFLWKMLPTQDLEWYRRLRRIRIFVDKSRRRAIGSTAAIMGKKFKEVLLSWEDEDSSGDALGSSPGVLDDGTVFELTHIAARKYEPRSFGAKVVLFYSSRLEGRVGSDAAGWERVADTEVYPIRGDHRSCVTKHVAYLAGLMRPFAVDNEPQSSEARADKVSR